MQDSRMLAAENTSNLMPRKKKIVASKRNDVQPVMAYIAPRPSKVSKRNPTIEGSPMNPQQERSHLGLLPDSSISGKDYRSLRRDYLLLEEESYTLGREFKIVEAEVNNLEDEKLALLDQLVVLEGLIDHSELQ